MASNTTVQRFPSSYSSSFSYHTSPTTRPIEQSGTYHTSKGWSGLSSHGISKRETTSPEVASQQQQINCSMPQDLSSTSNAVLFGVDHNVENQDVERSTVNNRSQRAPLRSSCSNVTAGQTSAGRVQTTGVRRQPKRRTSSAAKKYSCVQCGMQFTRNSNCKSHMKIHDPNRKFPHKCTAGQCTKKFTRKTDLDRHVNSVHEKRKVFPCNQCDASFSRTDTLRRHREVGCKRQCRRRQRATPNISTTIQSIESFQSPQTLFADSTSTFPEIDGQQRLHADYHSYFDNSSTVFPQYI
ncbi:hypothetical protein FQN50_004474 [Emmonsiellopsis sp. PD_5]|nr:hypothetical protein FQN50_004474 [Emmonsiellopsis sp. PD_5]